MRTCLVQATSRTSTKRITCKYRQGWDRQIYSRLEPNKPVLLRVSGATQWRGATLSSPFPSPPGLEETPTDDGSSYVRVRTQGRKCEISVKYYHSVHRMFSSGSYLLRRSTIGSLQSFATDALTASPTRTTSQLAGCHNVACATTATATSPGTASSTGLRSRRRRVPTCHGTLLVATLRPPRRHTVVYRAWMGPRMGPWRASTAPADADAAGVSRRGTSARARLPTTPLLLLLHFASLSQIR